ncbi:MAG: hypothetical protein N2376_07920 [Clostridia bacterium]|nr:hypothetical protein [Clostridia bacterium]
MKKGRLLATLLAVMLVTAMLAGCVSINMKVNSNGSCDVTYVIDTSQLNGMMNKSDIEKQAKDSIDKMNESAGKKIAKLKSIKEDKKKQTITAIISVSDINKMGSGTYFGTVKNYKKKFGGTGLDNLMDRKGKEVNEKKVSDNLDVVYLPMSGSEDYGLVEITVVVPGDIQYVSDGAEIKKGNAVLFTSETPLVVFKKGGGIPWLLILALVLIVYLVLRRKKPATTDSIITTPIMPQAPIATQVPVPAVPQEKLEQPEHEPLPAEEIKAIEGENHNDEGPQV